MPCQQIAGIKLPIIAQLFSLYLKSIRLHYTYHAIHFEIEQHGGWGMQNNVLVSYTIGVLIEEITLTDYFLRIKTGKKLLENEF